MASSTPSPSPKTRWYRRRKLLFVLVLLAGCAVALLTWDALLMPADLRRLQGAWKIVRAVEDGKEQSPLNDVFLIITGRRATLREKGRQDSVPFDIVPNRREAILYLEEDFQIGGITLPLLSKLRHDKALEVHYKITSEQLVLNFCNHENKSVGEWVLKRQ